MKSIGKWLGSVFFWAALSPLLAQAAEPDYSQLIIRVKQQIPDSGAQPNAIDSRSFNELKKLVPQIRPLVPASRVRTKEELQALQRHRLNRYFIVDTRFLTKKQAQALILKLKQNPLVEKADFEPKIDGMRGDNGKSVAKVAPGNIPDHTGRQNYLQGKEPVSPYRIGGVNAVQAWKIAGGKGQDMQVISAEIDHWSYDHVDLPKPYLELTDGAVTGSHDTESAGVIASRENEFGTTGIASHSSLGYLQWGSDRLVKLIDQLPVGAVMQLGVQYDYTPFREVGCTTECYMPLESNEMVRDTISYLTEENGVHVVLAAANGNINLDHPYFEGYFNREVFDSGAIYAGAVDPNSGLRAGYSEYGSRVDLFSWGWNVTTTTWSRRNPTTAYTHDFAGTSSANPILAGVVASLQGVARANGLGNIPPKDLREILVKTGYPQINGNSTEIGVQPDLDAAIRKMLDEGADKPPTGRLGLPEEVKSGEVFSAHVYAESPSQKPLTYDWNASGFTPPKGNTASLSLTAPTVTKDTVKAISVDVSDGRHTLTLTDNVLVKAPVEEGGCGDVPVWDASKIYQTYGESVAYKGKVYKQNFYNVNKQPDINSAEYGKEWFPGVACR